MHALHEEVRNTKTKKSLKIAMFVGQGIIAPFILEDIACALVELGHCIEFIRMGSDSLSLRESLAAVKPQILFSLDGKGFQDDITASKEYTRVTWFVDNPFYFDELKHLQPDDFIFVWDKEYISEIKKLGFKHVYFLPLATNPNRFHGLPLSEDDQARYACDVSFVGTIAKRPDDLKADRVGQYPEELNRLISSMMRITENIYVRSEALGALDAMTTTMGNLDPDLRPLIYLLLDQEVDACKRNNTLANKHGDF